MASWWRTAAARTWLLTHVGLAVATLAVVRESAAREAFDAVELDEAPSGKAAPDEAAGAPDEGSDEAAPADTAPDEAAPAQAAPADTAPDEAAPAQAAPADTAPDEPAHKVADQANADCRETEADAAAPRKQSQSDGAAPAEQEQAQMRLDLGADLTSLLGQGTFVGNEGARNPYFAWLLTLRPMLFPTKATRVFLFQNISQELTETESDTRSRRVLLSDTLLGGRVTFYTWPRTKTSFDAGLITTFPTSLRSQFETLRFALRPGLGISQPIAKKALVMVRTEFLKNFHAYTSPVGDLDDESNAFLARQGGSELVRSARVSPGGNNVSYEFWNRALLSYRFLEDWAFNTLLIVINGFTYERFPVDELSGEGARGGRGRRDQAYAEINAGYTFAQKYNLSGGIITQGSLTTANGRGVRFPFFDFSSASQNLTSLFLRFSITYPILGAPKTQAMPNIARRRHHHDL